MNLYEQRSSEWLDAATRGPDALFAALRSALLSCPESDRPTLSRHAVAFLFGPRLEPRVAQMVVRKITAGERDGGADGGAVAAAMDPDVIEIRRRRAELERRRNALVEASEERVALVELLAALTKTQAVRRTEWTQIQGELAKAGIELEVLV